MIRKLKLKPTLILTIIIISSILVIPTSAKNPWIRDELNDWYNPDTGDPADGVDWLDIRKTTITKFRDTLVLSTHVKKDIKAEQREYWAAFWWSIDIDKDPNTGSVLDFLGDLGYDYGVRVKYKIVDDAWTWTAVLQEYDSEGNIVDTTELDTFYINGATVKVLLPHSYLDYDEDFYWTSNTNDYFPGGDGTSGNIDKGMETYAEY